MYDFNTVGALLGLVVAIVLLALRPIANISIDPLVALPLGGLVSILVTGNVKNPIAFIEFGLSKVIGVSILLIGTGTIAGIIKASALQSDMITLIEAGVPAVSAAAMLHAGATVLDSLPHGSFFHATGGFVNMNISERMKLIAYEAVVGLTSTVVAVIFYLIAG